MGAEIVLTVWRRIAPAALSGSALLSALMMSAVAQDVPFRPRWDVLPKGKESSTAKPDSAATPPVMYSFARYDLDLRRLCAMLEHDGRRQRFVDVAKQHEQASTDCVSCKLFARQIAVSCRGPAVKPTPTAAAIPTVAQEVATTESDDQTVADESAEDTDTPTPSPIAEPTPPAARYPTTEMLDWVSQFSTTLYERDPGDGALFLAVKSMCDAVRQRSDLTTAEREYFAILFEYLLAAWQGRPGRSGDRTTPTSEQLRELFE